MVLIQLIERDRVHQQHTLGSLDFADGVSNLVVELVGVLLKLRSEMVTSTACIHVVTASQAHVRDRMMHAHLLTKRADGRCANLSIFGVILNVQIDNMDRLVLGFLPLLNA